MFLRSETLLSFLFHNCIIILIYLSIYLIWLETFYFNFSVKLQMIIKSNHKILDDIQKKMKESEKSYEIGMKMHFHLYITIAHYILFFLWSVFSLFFFDSSLVEIFQKNCNLRYHHVMS